MWDPASCKISYVQGMDKSVLEQWVFLYESYVKSNSATKSLRKHRKKFPWIQVPHRNTIQNHVSK
jgi:hypothetical protein